jgi:glycosyltransferase involved in cell wall biosynthesis
MKQSVAVIIPAYNAAQFIGEALESALSQTPSPDEVVVVDNRSEDETAAIAATFVPRVRIMPGPGLGPALARNIGILNTSSPVLAFLDADDVWLPGKLAKQLRLLDTESAGLVYSDYFYETAFVTAGVPRLQRFTSAKEPDPFQALLHGNFVLTSSVVTTRAVLASTGLFRSELMGGEDLELWLRIARRASFACVDEPLVFKRKHVANLTRDVDYDYYRVAAWQAIWREHSGLDDNIDMQIERRLTHCQFASGWHSMRTGRYALARSTFAGIPWKLDRFWQLARSRGIAALPDSALRWLHATKKWLATNK